MWPGLRRGEFRRKAFGLRNVEARVRLPRTLGRGRVAWVLAEAGAGLRTQSAAPRSDLSPPCPCPYPALAPASEKLRIHCERAEALAVRAGSGRRRRGAVPGADPVPGGRQVWPELPLTVPLLQLASRRAVVHPGLRWSPELRSQTCVLK